MVRTLSRWTGRGQVNTGQAQHLQEHVKGIREFPRPGNITDLRSYYSLVNQVAHYYALSPHLEPFRELMKKNTTCYWDEVLEKLFKESRENIANSIMDWKASPGTTRRGGQLSSLIGRSRGWGISCHRSIVGVRMLSGWLEGVYGGFIIH